MIDTALGRFAAEVAAGDREPRDLARAGLLLGLYARPGLDVGAYLGRVDDLAEEARARKLAPAETVASLFGPSRLQGDSDSYYDPRNSLLHEVLDRRKGIPISLSVLAIEVGRRLGIAVEGVPFPGHFLVRVRDGRTAALLDPFHGGTEVSDEDLLLRLRATVGRIGALGPAQLGPATPRQILTRMLQNLKVIYLKAEDWSNALAIAERMVALRPEELYERRDRGLLYARLGRAVEAESDLLQYLEASPGASDAPTVRQLLVEVRSRRGPVN